MYRELLSQYFEPLKELPCWNVTAEYGSWINLHFGAPHLDIREGNPASTARSMNRRVVFVEGEFHLWIEMGAWEMFENGKRVFQSEQSRSYLRRAASRLNGQKLVKVELQAQPVATVFGFDEGAQLKIHATPDAEPDDPLWHIYSAGNCLSLLASGTCEHGLSNESLRAQVRLETATYAI